MPEGGAVDTTRAHVEQIDEAKPNRAPDERGRPVAVAERVERPVHPELAARIAVDHDEDGAASGARGGPVQGEFLAQHGGQRGHHDGEVRGQAAGHHCIDRDLFRSNRPRAHRLHAEEVIGRQGGAREARLHRGFGRRHDGQPVRPAAAVEELLGGEDVFRFVDCGLEVHGPRARWARAYSIVRSAHGWRMYAYGSEPIDHGDAHSDWS